MTQRFINAAVAGFIIGIMLIGILSVMDRFGFFDSSLPVSYAQGSPVIIGKGCTTAFYIDADCDGHGVGMKSSGVYTIGINGEVQSTPLKETMGDLPDADDTDAAVNSTAQWEARWGAGTAGIRAFLLAKRAFSNYSRVFYLSMTGNDATAVVGNPAKPYRNLDTISQIIHDWQGGVIVYRGGTYTDPDGVFTTLGGARVLSGSSGHRLYVMAYPGERVEIVAAYALQFAGIAGGYAAGKFAGYLTLDGFILRTPNYGDGNPLDESGFADFTIINCEFSGGHQLSFAQHTVNLIFKGNVGHQFGTHFVYAVGALWPTDYGNNDFDFAAEEAKWVANTGPGPSHDWDVSDNIAYNIGSSGYEPWHFNTYAYNFRVRNNITTYSGGTAYKFQTGIYNSDFTGNYAAVQAGSCFEMSTFGDYLAINPNKIKNILIENNTCISGRERSGAGAVLIRGQGVNGGIVAADTCDPAVFPTERPIVNVTVRNNIIIFDNWSTFSGFPAFDLRKNSHPETWTIENNILWSHAPLGNPSTDVVMRISPDATSSDNIATRYTFAQVQAFGWLAISGNIYGNPAFTTFNRDWTLALGTPQLINPRVTSGAAIGAASSTGAPAFDITGAAFTNTIGAYQFGTAPSARGISGQTAVSGAASVR